MSIKFCLLFCLALGLWPEIIAQEEPYQMSFLAYDFNRDGAIEYSEFQRLFQSLFTEDERVHLTNQIMSKVFHYLDINGDNQLDIGEYRKVFQKWLLPLWFPDSAALVCVGLDSYHSPPVFLLPTTANRIFQLFKVKQLYLFHCDSTPVDLNEAREFLQHKYPHLNVQIYNNSVYLEAIRNQGIICNLNSSFLNLFSLVDFDRLIIDKVLIDTDGSTIDAVFDINSFKKVPTIFVTHSDHPLVEYFHEEYRPCSIEINLNTFDSVNTRFHYKTRMALILAQQLYYKYQK